MTAPRLFRVILPVSDTDEAAAFYERLLGISGERVSSNRHYFACGDVIVALVDPGGHLGQFRPNLEHVYFAVEDIDEAVKRAVAAGCSEPGTTGTPPAVAVQPWGERSFYIEDPSVIRFASFRRALSSRAAGSCRRPTA